jgi:hypothetical protein
MQYYLAAAVFIVATSASVALAQHSDMGMAMSKDTLLLAQLNAAQVAGGSQSQATGTGAFIFNPTGHSLNYSITYEGLGGVGAGSVGLYNFGPGKNGEPVRMICGKGAPACPAGGSATIAGQLAAAAGPAIDDRLIGEFDNGRVYVEVTDSNGLPQIRGQLEPNTAMVRSANFVAHLQPAAGVDSKGSGTAVLSQVFLPEGKTAVFYAVTVANTSGAPTGVMLTTADPGAANPLVLPGSAVRAGAIGHGAARGGTLTQQFQVAQAATGTQRQLVARLTALPTKPAGILVTTGQAPKGELYGTLTPVR